MAFYATTPFHGFTTGPGIANAEKFSMNYHDLTRHRKLLQGTELCRARA